jgi:hypothetical protein
MSSGLPHVTVTALAVAGSFILAALVSRRRSARHRVRRPARCDDQLVVVGRAHFEKGEQSLDYRFVEHLTFTIG